MRLIILCLMCISFLLSARTYQESRNNLRSFANAHTGSSSSSKKKDDDDDDDYSDDNDYSSDSTYIPGGSIGEFSTVWYWQAFFSDSKLKASEAMNQVDKNYRLAYASASYNYQYWKPTGINDARIDTTTLQYAKFDVSLLYNLFYFSYESSFNGTSINEQRELLEVRDKEKSGWERFFAEVTLPFLITYDDMPFARVYFGYDEQYFTSTVTSLDHKFYAPRDGREKSNELVNIKPGDKITTSTLFQDWFLGMRTERLSIFRFDIGFFFLKYNKPYSLTIDDQQFDEEIHDTDFSAIGAYLGGEISNGVFFVNTRFKFGGGDVTFVALDTTVDDLVSNDYSTAYFQFNGDIGLNYDFNPFLKFSAVAKMEYRNFYLSKPDSDSEDDVDDSESLSLNDDFIFTFYTGLTFAF